MCFHYFDGINIINAININILVHFLRLLQIYELPMLWRPHFEKHCATEFQMVTMSVGKLGKLHH
jgi:hypothetical protein